MKNKRNQNYSILKTILRIITLGIAVWALIISYQAKSMSEWVDKKQDNIIEQVLFKIK